MPSRLGQRVRGLAVANLDPQGRLDLGSEWPSSVWVAGRAAGATSYLESLESGIAVAECIWAEVERAEFGRGELAEVEVAEPERVAVRVVEGGGR